MYGLVQWPLLQLKAAEVLREEVRQEREKLSAREARLAGDQAALDAQRRDLDRQANELSAALQVRRWAG